MGPGPKKRNFFDIVVINRIRSKSAASHTYGKWYLCIYLSMRFSLGEGALSSSINLFCIFIFIWQNHKKSFFWPNTLNQSQLYPLVLLERFLLGKCNVNLFVPQHTLYTTSLFFAVYWLIFDGKTVRQYYTLHSSLKCARKGFHIR